MYVVMLSGYPNKDSAEEMAEFIRQKTDHYRWLKINILWEQKLEEDSGTVAS